MRRAAVAALAVVVGAAGCGGSSGGAPQPGSVGQVSVAKQHTVGFNVRVRLDVQGALKGAGPAAALLSGPVTLDLRGHTATSSTATRADFRFTVSLVGGVVSGQVLAPGGHTAYIQLPSLLGTGWRSFPVASGAGRALTGGASLAKLDPASWLTSVSSSSKGGTDTVSANLDVRKALAAILAVSRQALGAAGQRQIAQAESAVKAAAGSVSYSSATHLPSAFTAGLLIIVPPKLVATAHGVTSLHLGVSARLFDWGKPFSVSAPAASTPLRGLTITASGSR